MENFSISNPMSKGSVYESDSLFKAYQDDAASHIAGDMPEAISNEQICRGDMILETYRVEADAIHGGMGSVWRVHHMTWDAELAMKRPQPRFFAEAGERRKQEFVAECEHWINLGLHPNIVSCYYVRDIGGVPTIFSEWMDGGSLADAIRSGRLYGGDEAGVQARILDIAIQSARGLRYSHDQGLIHQDVKPGNILLTAEWEAKAADFGLAKARTQLSEGEKSVSSGYTLEYCPRAQAAGAEAEAWMDVYAWALTVVEMYAGGRLWRTGAEAAESIGTMLESCAHAVPRPMRALLTECLADRQGDFRAVEARLLECYRDVTGGEYARQEPREAEHTADSLNNMALSFVDLGKPELAEALWQQAEQRAPTDVTIAYNHGLFNWRANRLDNVQLIDTLTERMNKSGGQADGKQLIALLDRERGQDFMLSGRRRFGEDRYYSTVALDAEGRYAYLVEWEDKTDRRVIAKWDVDGNALVWRRKSKGLTAIGALSVSPDGALLAAAGLDGFVELWDAKDGACVRSLEHTPEKWRPRERGLMAVSVDGLAFSPDSSLLFSWSKDKYGRLWSVADGRRLDADDLNGAQAACFSHDGARLGLAGYALRQLDLRTGRLETLAEQLPERRDTRIKCYDMVYGPDDREIVMATDLGVLRFASGTVLRSRPGVAGNAGLVIALTPDGGQGVGARGGIYDLDTLHCRYSCDFNGTVAISADGRRALGITTRSECVVYPVPSGETEAAPWQLSVIRTSAALLEQQTLFAVLVKRAEEALREDRVGEALDCVDSLRKLPDAADSAVYLDLNRRVGARCAIAEALSIRGEELDEEEQEALARSLFPRHCVVPRVGKASLLGGRQISFHRVILRGGRNNCTDEELLNINVRGLTHIRVSPDGGTALTVAKPNRLVLWELKPGGAQLALKGCKGEVTALEFCGDHRVASADASGGICLWDARSGSLLNSTELAEAGWTTLALSGDGERIACGDRSGRIVVAELAGGRVLGRWQAAAGQEIAALAFSADGRRVWSTGVSGARGFNLADEYTLRLSLWIPGSQEPALETPLPRFCDRIAVPTQDRDTRICLGAWEKEGRYPSEYLRFEHKAVSACAFSVDYRYAQPED